MDAKRAEIFTDETYETIHGHKPFKPTKLTVEGALDYFYDHFCIRKKSAPRDAAIIRHFKARWSGRMLSDITTEDIVSLARTRHARDVEVVPVTLKDIFLDVAAQSGDMQR